MSWIRLVKVPNNRNLHLESFWKKPSQYDFLFVAIKSWYVKKPEFALIFDLLRFVNSILAGTGDRIASIEIWNNINLLVQALSGKPSTIFLHWKRIWWKNSKIAIEIEKPLEPNWKFALLIGYSKSIRVLLICSLLFKFEQLAIFCLIAETSKAKKPKVAGGNVFWRHSSLRLYLITVRVTSIKVLINFLLIANAFQSTRYGFHV